MEKPTRRDPKRMDAIIKQVLKDKNLTTGDFNKDSVIRAKIMVEAKERYSATFRIPYTTTVVNKYNDDGTLHPEYLER